jgi:hypothetical protein
MLVTALFVSSLAVSAASSGAADTNNNPVVLAADAAPNPEEEGFIDIWLPWHWGPITDQTPLEPEVAENIWVLLILGAVLGPINAFIPTLIVGDTVQVHEDFMIPQLVMGFVCWWGTYFAGIGAYLNAVGYVHRLDRFIKKSRGKPPAKWAGAEPAAESVAMAF